MTPDEHQNINSFLISERIKKHFLFMSREAFEQFESEKKQVKISEFPYTEERVMYKGKKYVVKCVAVISGGGCTTYVIDPSDLKSYKPNF